MPLTLTSRMEEDVVIVEFNGPLTLGPALNSLRQTAKDIIKNNPLGLILHVAGVTMTDSAGVGELTVVYSLTTRIGCPLLLAGVPPALRNILEITRLDALLPTAPDVASAKKMILSGAMKK